MAPLNVLVLQILFPEQQQKYYAEAISTGVWHIETVRYSRALPARRE
jgi:hypothetical protein